MGTWNGIELEGLTLATPRLILRPWQAQDAADVYAAAQDPLMREFLPIPDPYTKADAEDYANQLGDEGRASGSGIGSALVERSTGRLVGSAALHLPAAGGRLAGLGDGHPFRQSAEIGYCIYPWARQQGYAIEASQAYVEWAFAHGLTRLEIHCSVRNLPSAKTALAAGFRFETIARQAIATRDEADSRAIFARLAADDGRAIAPALPPFPPAGLNDGVLRLRITAPTDAAALIREHDDPLTMSWAFDQRHADPVQLAAVAAMSGLQWLVGPVGRLAMIDVASGDVAGSMQLRLAGPPDVLGIGYGVQAAFRGRGYTTRGLRMLMAWAFDQPGITRLELGAKLANIASQKAARYAGFQADGIALARLRNPDGSFSDEARFAAIRP